jgi:hypothetical protein
MKATSIFLIVLGGMLANWIPLYARTTIPVFDPKLAAIADRDFDLATYEKLLETKVDVKWNGTNSSIALADLSAKSAFAASDHKKILFSISLSGADPLATAKVHGQVQIVIERASIWEVLQYFSGQTNLIPIIHRNSVTMVPGRETRLSIRPVE